MAVANHIYRLPREKPTPAPYALTLGLDWLEFHVPPVAGGHYDQPIRLMRQIRTALQTYKAITAYRSAQQMSAESFTKFCSANSDIVKFMSEIWAMQDEAEKEQEHATTS